MSITPHTLNVVRPTVSPRANRDWPFLIYIGMSLGVTMSLGQYYEESGGFIYWALTMPLALLPLARPMIMLDAARGAAFPAVLFAVIGGGWHFVRGDSGAALQAVLLGWGLVWVGSRAARIRIDDLYILYGLAVCVGVLVWLAGDLNQWGVLPGTTSAVGEAVWRVSFFPNIAYTGFLSLILIMVAMRDPRPRRRLAVIVVAVAAYFVVFSFVRTAVVGLITFAALGWLFRRSRSPALLFWAALGSAVFVNIVIVYSPGWFAMLQNNPIISRVFLRGETGLSEYEIWQQLYRPFLWDQHIQQFLSSPFLMGWGSVDFNELRTSDLVAGYDQVGEISLPTRLLAQYGLAGALLLVWIVARLRALAKSGDAWGCACFPAATLAMLHWGTMFHPTDAMFGLLVMILLHGSLALPEVRERISRPVGGRVST